MKSIILFSTVFTLFFPLICKAGAGPDFQDERVRLSYSIGYQVSGDFKQQGQELNPELVLEGIKDALKGTDTRMTSSEMQKSLVDLRKTIVKREIQSMQQTGEKPGSK